VDLGLSGRTALVTGASKGIGRATALALAGEGKAALVIMIESRPMDFLQGAIIEFDGGKTRAL
jgi:NAD(P)-dependent dehydrogenase (short-subunit alcohol dehydrogenase family)